MPTFADTTVLNNFAQIRRPDLLSSACPNLSAPASVWSELDLGVRRGLVPACDWSWLKILDLSQREQAQADRFGRALDPGEAACIAMAASRGGLMLSDDWKARAFGRSLGLEVSGSLGVLNNLVSKRILSLDEADALLTEMVRCGFRSPYRSLREIPR
jgi:predicted nucleic acid-binding protein